MLTIQGKKVIDTMQHINPGARKIEDEPYQPPKEERALPERVFNVENRICKLEKDVAKLAETFAEGDANFQQQIKDLIQVIEILHPDFAALVKKEGK